MNVLLVIVVYSVGKVIEVLCCDFFIVMWFYDNVCVIWEGLVGFGFECFELLIVIIFIMIGDEVEVICKSKKFFELGLMVIGFGFLVVFCGEVCFCV